MKAKTPHEVGTKTTLKREEHRHLDRQVRNLDGPTKADPLQAKLSNYPAPPMPTKHLDKPGLESELELKPMFEAPHYRGSGKLDGLVALITGGDSGIGRAVAVLFAREGADVSFSFLNETTDAGDTSEAVAREGRRCISTMGDVADPKYCEEAVQETLNKFGRIDILVNNAAFQQHVDDIDDLSLEQFDHTLRTNLRGYFNMVKSTLPHLREGASIIMTGSVTAMEGSKGLLDYAMTKGGIHSFARSLASQLAPRGIRVNVVAPGPVWTPLNPADVSGDKLAYFGSDTLLGRPAQPEEIAPAFVFLASPCCSSYITGEIIPIIGGYK